MEKSVLIDTYSHTSLLILPSNVMIRVNWYLVFTCLKLCKHCSLLNQIVSYFCYNLLFFLNLLLSHFFFFFYFFWYLMLSPTKSQNWSNTTYLFSAWLTPAGVVDSVFSLDTLLQEALTLLFHSHRSIHWSPCFPGAKILRLREIKELFLMLQS